jgi:hypothetical protein
MPTASFFSFNHFPESVNEKKIDFSADTFKVMLSNQAPLASNSVKSDITEISAAGGYDAGGKTVPIASSSQAGGVYTALVNTTLTWTGISPGFGPFRYSYMYDDTSATKVLIGAWDFGSSISVADSAQFQWQMNTNLISMQKV